MALSNIKMAASAPQTADGQTTSKVQNIPLDRLKPSAHNVRANATDPNLPELVASIAAHGLMTSLAVKPIADENGDWIEYEVIAGQRRLRALNMLADDGRLDRDAAVPCCIFIAGDADATELSLAENIVRSNMHPADQFTAFSSLIEGGTPVPDIAARFGVTERVVQQRLRLSRVAPDILESYRNGDLTLAQVQAFATTDDKDRQLEYFKGATSWNMSPDRIRDNMSTDRVTAADKRVKFITLQTYRDAGGTTTQDLFVEDEHGVFIDDVPLLEKLCAQRLEQEAEAVRAEGWNWIDIRYMDDANTQYHREYASRLPMNETDKAEYDRLENEAAELWEKANEFDYGDEKAEEFEEKAQELEDKAEQIADKYYDFDALVKTYGGAQISIGYSGGISVDRGLIRKQDKSRFLAAKNATENGAAPQTTTQDNENSDPVTGTVAAIAHSKSHAAELIKTKAETIAYELSENPRIAFAVLAHKIISQCFYGMSTLCGKICTIRQDVKKYDRLSEDINHWWETELPPPEKYDDLWQWCLDQDQSSLIDILAVCTAMSIEISDEDNWLERQNANLISNALNLDMAKHFTPTAANYFGRINAIGILACIREITGAETTPAQEKMKKKALAAEAEHIAENTGWLPTPLRLDNYSYTPVEQEEK